MSKSYIADAITNLNYMVLLTSEHIKVMIKIQNVCPF